MLRQFDDALLRLQEDAAGEDVSRECPPALT